ncbi:MAG: hypothetical protein RR751_01995, partial [Clostridia bacterium]
MKKSIIVGIILALILVGAMAIKVDSIKEKARAEYKVETVSTANVANEAKETKAENIAKEENQYKDLKVNKMETAKTDISINFIILKYIFIVIMIIFTLTVAYEFSFNK